MLVLENVLLGIVSVCTFFIFPTNCQIVKNEKKRRFEHLVLDFVGGGFFGVHFVCCSLHR